jgi:hypothetical protein
MTHGSRAGEVRDPISQCDFGSLDFFAGSDEEFGSSPPGCGKYACFSFYMSADERNRAQEDDWT